MQTKRRCGLLLVMFLGFAGRLWLQCRFDTRDVLLNRRARDYLSDDIQRKLLNLLEPNAGFAHVQLLACCLVSLAEPTLSFPVPIDIAQVDGHVILLGAQRGIGKGVAWLAVIACWIETMRHHIPDHSI